MEDKNGLTQEDIRNYNITMAVKERHAQVMDDLANEEYHKITTHIGHSGILEIRRSPRHFYERYLNPNRIIEEPTEAMAFGSMYHTLILEPTKFFGRYIFKPEIDKPLSNDGKAQLRAFKEANAGKIIITQKQYQLAEEMKTALLKYDKAVEYLEGDKEQSFFVEIDGVPYKVRLDNLGASCIADLKTCTDASKANFSKEAYNRGYYIQAAMYCDVIQAITGQYLPMQFINQEKTPPYFVGIYDLDEDSLALGRKHYRDAGQVYNICRENDVWLGYQDDSETISLPRWAFND